MDLAKSHGWTIVSIPPICMHNKKHEEQGLNVNHETVAIHQPAVYDERPKSPIEKRKRNLKLFSPISRGEGEIWKSFPQFWEEKEKFEKRFSTFEKRKRKEYSFLKLQKEKEKVKINSPFSRRDREIWNAALQLWEEKEKFENRFSTFEKRKRNGYSFFKLQEEKENFEN